MKKVYIKNCSDEFNYGMISDNVGVCSYLWQEDEEPNLYTIVDDIKDEVETKCVYLFTGKSNFFPMNFADKKYGLWRSIEKLYDLNILNQFEDKLMLNRFYLLFGIAEVSVKNFEAMLQILTKEYRNSYILITENRLESLEDCRSSLYINEKQSQYYLKFNDIVNVCCKKQTDMLITAIQGYDGVSVNLFKQKTERQKKTGDGSMS